MKIRTIRLYNIEVMQNSNIVYQDSVENAPEELLNCDIQHIEFVSNCLRITI